MRDGFSFFFFFVHNHVATGVSLCIQFIPSLYDYILHARAARTIELILMATKREQATEIGQR